MKPYYSCSTHSSVSSVETVEPPDKKKAIHDKIVFILEKKIQHFVGLEDYDLDYINTDCDEKDQLRFIQAYNDVMKNLRDFIKKHPDDFPQIVKHHSFYKIDQITQEMEIETDVLMNE